MATCEVFNNSDIAFIGESYQVFNVNLVMFGVSEDVIPEIEFMEWRMSRFGESECLVKKNNIDCPNDIVQTLNSITIKLKSEDTKDMFGKFTHQLIIKDPNNTFAADLGKLTIKSIIK